MNELSAKKNIIVGFFVFLGLAFLIIGILMIGDLHKTFEKKINIVCYFDDVAGLQKGNNVWLSGVKIGTVSELNFYGNSKVKVQFQIYEKTKPYIRKNSKVKLGSDGLIGNRILVIYGGNEESNIIEEGDTLAVEKTFSSEDMLNTLQKNNENILAITDNFKTLSGNLLKTEGTVGKLLNENSVYDNINSATKSLQQASEKAQQLAQSLYQFSSNLNKEGTLVNDLTTDTVVFNSLKTTITQLQQISDSASVFLSSVKNEASNPNSTLGILMSDNETGASLKTTIKNLESSSQKLDEDLEALQHSPLLRRYFKKKQRKDSK